MATPIDALDLPTLDAFDPAFVADPFRAIHELSLRSRLARSPFGVIVLRYEDCQAALRDPRLHQGIQRLQDLQQITDERFLARRGQSLLTIEGDEHTRLRKLVSKAFTPRATDRLRPLMRRTIDALLDPVTPLGRADFVADISAPYPIPIVCALLGAPPEDLDRFDRWAEDILKSLGFNLRNDLPAILAAQDEMDLYMEALIEQRRRDPQPDLLSDLIAAEEAGDRLTHAELVVMAQTIMLAGTDTTRNQLAIAVWLLAQHPEQWALLAARPELAAGAADEALRFNGAIRSTLRIATTDIELADATIPAGTMIIPSFAAANRDPRHFIEPLRFDITRTGERSHLTFGGGTHYCLGANLARAELSEALAVLARRLPDLALDGDVTWRPPIGIQGPTSLPIRFTATP
ncbi:MAG: cytochrome P450 [Acidimicrobiales bacterium]|nr:cytochrome P450 [Acidimicrobiales bacterium]